MSTRDEIAGRLCETFQFDLGEAFKGTAGDALDLCESPIEAALLAAILITIRLPFFRISGEKPLNFFWVAPPEFQGEASQDVIIWTIPQYKWNNFRIDLAFFAAAHKPALMFVECDGHQFHERTPEQAERDRSRDRACQLADIPVLRFTGREIWRDPFRCAGEALQFLSLQIRK